MTSQENLKEFETIYDQTYHDLECFLTIRCKNIRDVDDLLQDIYVEFFRSFEKKLGMKDPRKYLFGIAKHKIHKYYLFHYQTFFLFSKEEEDLEIPDDQNILEETIQNIDLEEAWKFLKNKKAIIYKIFYFYYHEDYTIKEIAQILHVGESFVKNSLYRTLKELQEVLVKEDIT